jgi:hypothetical protein
MSTQITATSPTEAPQSAFHRLVLTSLGAMLLAGAANLVLYAVAGRFFPQVAAWPGAGPGQIIGATVVYLFLGTIVFAVINRWSSRPARTYLLVASAALLLSLALPIAAGFGYAAPSVPQPGTATVVTLSLMHVLAYAISVPMFLRLARS